jgi:ceramide glucosyltransferase
LRFRAARVVIGMSYESPKKQSLQELPAIDAMTMERHLDMIAQFAGGASAALTAIHIGTTLLTGIRQRKRKHYDRRTDAPGISIIRPLRGSEPFTYETLKSTFALHPAPSEILFCVESRSDPVADIVERLIAEHPHIPARLLVGRDVISGNPKLNNLVKGWQAATSDWIAFIDSNVLLPVDALARLAEKSDAGTGLVSSPPTGSTSGGFAARLECAFLNSHQARWQSTADALGYGFAQGKAMLVRRDVVEAGGGIEMLGSEPAEDAAATKMVRRLGLRVRLVDRFFEQPIAERTISDVWSRQLRWAQLRRATFPVQFTTEILAGGLLPLTLTAIACSAAGWPVPPVVMAHFGIWYAAEHLLARLAGWPGTVVASLARDVLLPVLWVQAWLSRDFVWHGQTMRAEREPSPPALNPGRARRIGHSPGGVPQNTA